MRAFARFFAFAGLCLACCLPTQAQEMRAPSKGQTLYLPIYSHMLYGNLDKKGNALRVPLSALVSIRNTDPKQPLRLLSARYFNTRGVFLRDYVPIALQLPPLGTAELFVALHDESGGSGANFLLRWDAEATISPPLVEAVHANMDGGKAVVFTTQAVPVKGE